VAKELLAAKRLEIPVCGTSAQAIIEELECRKAKDADWRNGRSWSLVYYAGDELDGFLKSAYETYFSENGVSPSAFPREALMCRKIMAFRYSPVCRVRHAHHESTACMFFSVRTAHPTWVH
jgi:hypothetical protein